MIIVVNTLGAQLKDTFANVSTQLGSAGKSSQYSQLLQRNTPDRIPASAVLAACGAATARRQLTTKIRSGSRSRVSFGGA
jgi:hypothetical protein